MPCNCNGSSSTYDPAPTLMGYGYQPQAGSPGTAPNSWKMPKNLYSRFGNYPHSPLGLLPHQDEQRALEMLRRRLSGFGAVTTDAQRDPHVTGMVRALQTRVASVAASQNGALTQAQHAQAQRVRRQIARRQGLSGYVAMDFVMPTPLDTGTTVQDVAAQNFPLFTNGATPGTGQAAAAPAPASTGPSMLTIISAAAAGWYLWKQLSK